MELIVFLFRLGGLGNAGGPLVYGSFGFSQDDKEVSRFKACLHDLNRDADVVVDTHPGQ